MNKFLAIGNLTKDPECRDAGSSKVCKFSIAINEYYYVDSQKKQTTTYVDVETWSKQAENCSKFLEKGKKVAIEGKLKTNSWEKNGQKYSKLFCVADKVHFLGGEDSNNSSANLEQEKKVENIEDYDEDIEEDLPPF